VTRRHTWGEDRVFFRDEEGQLRSMPTAWTSVAAPDPFVVVAAGRCLCRYEDLVALGALVRDLKQAAGGMWEAERCV
jgi:hypothetical protein